MRQSRIEARLIQPDFDAAQPGLPLITRSIPARIRRIGRETKLLIEADRDRVREPDRSLLRLLARAHQFQQAVMVHQGKSMQDLARDAGVGPSYFARVLRLAFLSPDIVHAILQGRQADSLTANKLQHLRLPNAWADQRHKLQTT